MFCSNCGTKLNENGVCANCNTAASTTSNGKTVRVVISRPSAFFGFAVKYKVFVDGNEVGALANNSKIEIALPAGSHTLAFDMWSASNAHQINIPDNCNVFYVDTKIKMGLLTNTIAITNTRVE